METKRCKGCNCLITNEGQFTPSVWPTVKYCTRECYFTNPPNRWRDYELAMLEELYPHFGIAITSAIIDTKTYDQVRTKATQLGLEANRDYGLIAECILSALSNGVKLETQTVTNSIIAKRIAVIRACKVARGERPSRPTFQNLIRS